MNNLKWNLRRSAGGTQVHTKGSCTASANRSSRYVCHPHIRYHRPWILFRCPPQNMLRHWQPRWVKYQTTSCLVPSSNSLYTCGVARCRSMDWKITVPFLPYLPKSWAAVPTLITAVRDDQRGARVDHIPHVNYSWARSKWNICRRSIDR